MSIHNPRIFCLIFLGILGCSGNNQMASGIKIEQTESALESNEIESSTNYLDTPENSDSSIAIEPIPIGGAYLTCRYQDVAKQGDSSYPIDCSLNLPAGIIVQTLTASFHKIDTEGRAYPLDLIKETLNPLSWVIRDTAATYFMRTIEATIKINGSADTLFRTDITAPALIERVANYWLGGEPNNDLRLVAAYENCAEYRNLAGKIYHASLSRLTSGPLGRINDDLCTTSHNFLCKNIHDSEAPKWLVSTMVAPFTSYPTACPKGFRFAMPLVDSEFMEVNTLIDKNPNMIQLWIPLQDREKEGEFRTVF